MPWLVELIETGDLASPALRQMLLGYVQPLLAAGCDTLILGCTHYPFLRPLLADLVPADVAIIDTGAAVARQLQRLLGANDLLAEGPAGDTRFWTSADPEFLRKILPVLWHKSDDVQSFAL